MTTASWHSQLRKGASELVVLSLLAHGERYGVQLLNEAESAGSMLSEGTIYPLLARLEREGKLSSRWVLDAEASHPRKYYRLTATGTRLVKEMRQAWIVFRTTMTAIVEKSS
jgi:PadR family transcriptional regulator PadR